MKATRARKPSKVDRLIDELTRQATAQTQAAEWMVRTLQQYHNALALLDVKAAELQNLAALAKSSCEWAEAHRKAAETAERQATESSRLALDYIQRAGITKKDGVL